jgi:hypothetical protein
MVKTTSGLMCQPSAKYGSRGKIFGIAFAGAGSDPGVDGGDVGVAEAGIVEELAYLGIGVPGRHLALYDRFANLSRPGTGIFICHQRHGSDVVGTMAGDTVLVEDGSHVAVVGGFFRRTRLSRVVLPGAEEQTAKRYCDKD